MAPITEAIILAGGLGTRLKSAVPDKPKCMAPVAGYPFIDFVIHYARQQGITRFLMALGYQADMLVTHLEENYPGLEIVYSTETEPLGTGGAIQLACMQAVTENVLVLNGDTQFDYELAALARFHREKQSHCTLALKAMRQFNRYGVVETDGRGCIQLFREKQYYETGHINAGVYIINTKELLRKNMPVKFSFEKDYLEAFTAEQSFFGMPGDGYFIDIGIPEDYERAQLELAGRL
jgi:D-glycero-alpha-D-manno-heptose 1-phosphate guanylyltransferase